MPVLGFLFIVTPYLFSNAVSLICSSHALLIRCKKCWSDSFGCCWNLDSDFLFFFILLSEAFNDEVLFFLVSSQLLAFSFNSIILDKLFGIFCSSGFDGGAFILSFMLYGKIIMNNKFKEYIHDMYLSAHYFNW